MIPCRFYALERFTVLLDRLTSIEMQATTLFVAPEELLHMSVAGDVPRLAVIDLSAAPDLSGLADLPSCPLIGWSEGSVPGQERLDVLVQSESELQQIITAVCAKPEAASILVQLLRLIDGVDTRSALVAESLAYATLQGGAEHKEWLKSRPERAPEQSGAVSVERQADTLESTVQRAHAYNAINADIRDGLRGAMELAVLDDTIARIDLRGEGRAFGVGADLSEFGSVSDGAQAHAIRMATLPAHMAARCADRMVAHVQGLCVGASLELAAFASRIVARRNAIFQLPELAMGIIPGAGGCVSLSRRIGRQRTAQMILSGRRISARTALAWGLVDAIVD